MVVRIKQILTCKPSSALIVVCPLRLSFAIKWKKHRQWDEQQLHSLIIILKIEKVTYVNRGASMLCCSHFFPRWKKLPHGFTHELCVSLLFSEYGASGFKIHVKSFYRLFARFRKNKWHATNPWVFYFLTAFSGRHLIPSPPPPPEPPTIHSYSS